MSSGKGAMVWKLRDWEGGAPNAQVAQTLSLGLKHVSIKIVDGRQEKWEGNRADQNKDLLPGTLNALRSAGIEVTAWGWTYGGTFIWKSETKKWVHRPNAAVAHAEGVLAGELCVRYSFSEFLIDAESQYNKSGMEASAEQYMLGFESVAPNVDHLLCSYRFPLTSQPAFPVHEFSPFQEGWAPQVYFLGDNRPTGGATQLEISFNQYKSIRQLPYMPVAPTYEAKLRTGLWRATGEQLRHFFQKALDLGNPGFSVWDLPKASPEQLAAIKNFPWPNGGTEPPIPPPDETIQVGVTVPTGKATVTVREV